MDVQLYVYDLSKGLARQWSRSFLGTYIDAVYHTALVFGGIEYFYGQGIQTCYPGSTHHGAPIEKIALGITSLPAEVISEYLESLKEIYTAESYDLFLHNCNNFSHDFATFLLGHGIPDRITSLPETVLNTPFGQMLKPQLDSAMRSMTQAPVPLQAIPPARAPMASQNNGHRPAPHVPIQAVPQPGVVRNVTTLHEVEKLLASASSSCAVIFFTSATCPPCKIVYPAYDQLAAEAGDKAILIKVDLSKAYDVGAKYSVRATPTFITYLKGQQQDQWSGANEGQLRGNVRLLLQMATPTHPHVNLNLPIFSRTSLKPVTYGKLPPLEKLIIKMGDAGKDPSVICIKDFVDARFSSGAKEAPLPDVSAFTSFLRSSMHELPPEIVFTIVDLLRVALVDQRFSGYLAEEADHKTIVAMFNYVNERSIQDCPYSLRLVTLQAACNLFTSPLYPEQLLGELSLSIPIIQLVTTSLLDDKHASLRVVAASLAFNIASYNHKQRADADREVLPEGDQVELTASLLEALAAEEESAEAVKGLLLAMGLLIYRAPDDGEVLDLCKAMDAAGTVKGKGTKFGNEPLLKEVGNELLGKALR
ncbi:MAG: hypothetical protein M1827_001507 [Pycnora praestabilis]|nr:MAG: hypothetical protein M1827_001507 [Pycnora praestabilis]